MTLAYHAALTSPIRVPDYIIVSRPRRILVAEILRVTCEHYGITRDEIVGPSRFAIVTHPRMLAMYISRKITPRSFSEIGRTFGGRDHSTVLSAVRTVERRLASNADLRADHDAIVEALGE